MIRFDPGAIKRSRIAELLSIEDEDYLVLFIQELICGGWCIFY